MKYFYLLVLSCACLSAGTTYRVGTVCTPSCDYGPTQIQTALDVAQYGDTIEITAGETFTLTTGLTLPPKYCADVLLANRPCVPWINIQTSRWTELLAARPRGYRVRRDPWYSAEEDAAYMPTILGPLLAASAFGTPEQTYDATISGSATFNVQTGTGIANYDPIAVAAKTLSPYLCTAVGDTIVDCLAGDEGYLKTRDGSPSQPVQVYTNGTPIYVHGQLPTGLTEGWYYVVNGSSGKYQLAATPGGAPIYLTRPASGEMPQFQTVIGPKPLMDGVVYYARNVTSTTFQLAATPDPAEPIITLDSAGLELQIAPLKLRTSGWRFRGIEVTQQVDAVRTYSLINLGTNSGIMIHRGQLSSRFEFDKMYVHGRPWQDGPRACIRGDANDITIRDSVLTEAKDFGNQQAQGFLSIWSAGRHWIENSVLAGQGESAMWGGGQIFMRDVQPSSITILRNLMTKSLHWWQGFRAYRMSTTEIQVRHVTQQQASDRDCAAAAAAAAATDGPTAACYSYWDESLASRTTYDDDMTATLVSGTSGAWRFWETSSRTLVFAHNVGAGAFTCSTGWTCLYQATLTWPTGARRINSGTVAAGAISTTIAQYFMWDTRNTLEFKSGRNVRAEGNFFKGCWWTSTFDTCISINPKNAGNNTYTDPVMYWLGSYDNIFRNNVFAYGVAAIGGSGQKGQILTRPEQEIKIGKRSVFENNLLYQFGGFHWGRGGAAGTQNRPYSLSNSDEWRLSHNTLIDADQYMGYNPGIHSGQVWDGNIAVHRTRLSSGDPYLGIMPHILGDGSPWWDFFVTNAKCIGCVWDRNIITNPTSTNHATHYTLSVPSGVPGGASYLNIANTCASGAGTGGCVAEISPTFVSSGYRIPAGSTYGAGGSLAASDGRAMGADIDEIEAETGVMGADIVAGIPKYSVRSVSSLTTATTTATLSYKQLTAGATCTTTAYTSRTYATVATSATDTALSVGAFHTVTLTGLTSGTTYPAKRICTDGIEVLRITTR